MFVIALAIVIVANGSATPIEFASDADQPLTFAVYRPRRAADNGNSVSVAVDHGRHGTNVGVEAQRRLWQSQNGRSTIDGQANYNQHFGPRSPPNYGVGVQFRHRF